MPDPRSNGNLRRPSVAVVGAGFGGVGMAIRLKMAGFEDVTVFERGETVGGVWRANTYPGAACDVPSHLYSFSFARGDRWSRRFAPQEEILAYLERTVDEFGLRPHLRLGTEVSAAAFDEASGRWTLTTDGGEHLADLLVTACGQLTTPAIPAVPGIEDFEGPRFHSADWDHSVELTGKDVAVVGTGASAIQFVPAIAPRTSALTIYQRSAPWILPKNDREYPEWEQRLFGRFPARVAASRLANFAVFEAFTYGFTGSDAVMKPVRAVADLYRKRELADPELRRRATPDYEIGCKRVLITNDWYSTLARPDVELLDEPIERVTARGIVGADGIERPADAIVFGTGFRSHDFVAPMEVRGIDGRELGEVWRTDPGAHLGTAVSGFPNMFVLYGPNTNHGAGSVIFTLECQFNQVVDAAERLRDGRLRYLAVRPEAQERWQAEIDRRSADTVWITGGCGNWYVDEQGRNANNWVGPWLEYQRRTRRIDPADYTFVA